MPTYEFKCSECDTVFELRRRIGDLKGAVCPECGAPAKRIFSPVGVVFKGSGFHNTDYRKRPEEKGSKKEPAADSSKDSSAGKTSESPAPASE